MVQKVINDKLQLFGCQSLQDMVDTDIVDPQDGDTLTWDRFRGRFVNKRQFKTFSTASDEEIAEMVKLADLGYIDLYEDCGWRVGQEHKIQLSAIAATGTYNGTTWTVGEAQPSQTVTLVLMHRGLYQLVNPVRGTDGTARSTCSFIVGMKDCMNTLGYRNSTANYTSSWNGCARRNWCNGGFRQAIPAVLRPIFKQFKTITGVYNNHAQTGGTNVTSNDYFALPAEKEVVGDNAVGPTNESSALTQFTWYESQINRIKTGNYDIISSSTNIWSLRTPDWWNSTLCMHINNVGSQGPYSSASSASSAVGLSPFGCI